ncbi:hypothetical protein BDY19DRAFT_144380 [Irpex rosettiformis]|uniref:Uncharacterized protein n=1 Tax=Irpex rosettiformis TaxID=378272 RepID=A0ACB8U2Z8_9APHY|nr:hypothetical protein BDY19DRAFT_144380 [Irpex rosettiformis]
MSGYFSSQQFVPAHTSKAFSGTSSGMDEVTDGSESLLQSTPVGTSSRSVLPFSGNSGTTTQLSNAFNPVAGLDVLPPNVILISSDNVFFAVHQHRLISVSFNNFGGLLVPGSKPTRDNPVTLTVPEDSSVVNVVLHCVYDISCDSYHPTFTCLTASLPALKRYGLALSQYLARGTHLFNTVLNYAPLRPIETYTLVASHQLEDLAAAASSYTLHIKLYQIPHNLTDNMGTTYLQRLHQLHALRTAKLKELLDTKLFPHVARPYCSVEQRQVVSRAYHLAGAQVFYDATPAISRPGIEKVMYDLIDAVTCPDCRESLITHVEELITTWMLFKRTI